MNILLVLAVLPVVVLLVFVYKKDSISPEPIGKLLLVFFAGCLSVVPAALMEAWLSPLGPSAEGYPVLSGLYNGFCVAGLCEELCKLILLTLFVWRSPYFDEYFDGVVYAAYLSLGFACVENIQYVFMSTDAILTAFMRGLLAVPAHFLFAVTMGYYFSLAKFDMPNRKKHFAHALLYPVLLHGTYDALLMVSSNLSAQADNQDLVVGVVSSVLTIVFVYFDVKMWRWGMARIKKMQQRSKEQQFDRMHPFDGFSWKF